MEYNEWHRTLLDFTMILHGMHRLHADSVQNGWESVKYCKKDYKKKTTKKATKSTAKKTTKKTTKTTKKDYKERLQRLKKRL